MLSRRAAGSRPSVQRSCDPSLRPPWSRTDSGNLRRCVPWRLRPCSLGLCVHLRTNPGALGLVIVISATLLPITFWMMVPTAVDEMQCAHGYSGCIGVSPRGNHDASRAVSLFPLRSALRIAVMGRQRLKVYLASKTAMKASLLAMAARANRRAQSTTFISLPVATWRRMGFQVCGPLVNQKRPMFVCSAVRLALARAPSSWISFTSFVHVDEVSAGGGAGRTVIRSS